MGLIVLFVIIVVSMPLASIIGLGPAEFWILPAFFLVVAAVVLAMRHRRIAGPRDPH